MLTSSDQNGGGAKPPGQPPGRALGGRLLGWFRSLVQRTVRRQTPGPGGWWTGRSETGRSAGRNLRTAFATVQPAAADLKRVSAALESGFLATSAGLIQLTREGDRFVEDSERLVNLATGQDGGGAILLRSARLVKEPLEFLNTWQAQTNSLLSELERDRHRIERLLGVEGDLQRTMAPLNFVQTLFKVESAPLGPEAQVTFGSLTQEIAELRSQVGEFFTVKFEELRLLQRTISEVAETLGAQSRSLEALVSTQKVQIEESLRRLESQLTANHARDARIHRLSRQIGREIQQVVIGVQFQDLINQKLQHTAGAVARIGQKLQTSDEVLGFLEQSCRLEAEQLLAVRGDLVKAEQTVKEGICNVLRHVTQANADCLSLREFEQITTSVDGMVQELLKIIATVRQQVAATVAGSTRAMETLRPIGTMTSDLTGLVRSLARRMHLLGLNAQVQAAQISHGSGLEVLSARTSEISRETTRLGQTLATDLDELSAGLSATVQAFAQLHTQALGHQAQLEAQGSAEERNLHAFRDEALRKLHAIHDSFARIQDQAGDTLQTVNYVQTADGALAALETPLRSIAEAARLRLAAGSERSQNHVADFKRNYTMASERDVYSRVILAGEPSPQPSPSARPLVVTPPLGPAGSRASVRTPAEPAPAQKQPPAGPPSLPPAAGEVAKLTAAVSATPEEPGQPSAPADGEDLGSNVELF